jgi:hypothetical protein
MHFSSGTVSYSELVASDSRRQIVRTTAAARKSCVGLSRTREVRREREQ